MKENKLIAEFMGHELEEVEIFREKTYGYYVPYPLENQKTRMFGDEGLAKFVYPEHLKYHESWDWLMPVVEKIEMLDCVLAVTISTNDVTIESMNGEFKDIEITRWEDEDSIRGVYKAVINFIQWYNDGQKTIDKDNS